MQGRDGLDTAGTSYGNKPPASSVHGYFWHDSNSHPFVFRLCGFSKISSNVVRVSHSQICMEIRCVVAFLRLQRVRRFPGVFESSAGCRLCFTTAWLQTNCLRLHPHLPCSPRAWNHISYPIGRCQHVTEKPLANVMDVRTHCSIYLNFQREL